MKVCCRGALLRGGCTERGGYVTRMNRDEGGGQLCTPTLPRPPLLGATRPTRDVFVVLCSVDLAVGPTTAKLRLRAADFNKGGPAPGPHLSFPPVDQSGVPKPRHGGSWKSREPCYMSHDMHFFFFFFN